MQKTNAKSENFDAKLDAICKTSNVGNLHAVHYFNTMEEIIHLCEHDDNVVPQSPHFLTSDEGNVGSRNVFVVSSQLFGRLTYQKPLGIFDVKRTRSPWNQNSAANEFKLLLKARTFR